MRKALVVNLYGGPGAGKTAFAHMLIGTIKSLGPATSVEMVAEVAKDLVLEKRAKTIGVQEYILGQQRMLTEIRMDEVDVIVTDAPIINSAIYKPEGYPDAFVEFVVWAAKQTPSIEIFVHRVAQPFDPVGRYHTEAESVDIDHRVRAFLIEHGFGPIQDVAPTFADAAILAATIVERVRERQYDLDLFGKHPHQDRADWSRALP